MPECIKDRGSRNFCSESQQEKKLVWSSFKGIYINDGYDLELNCTLCV